MKCKRCGQELDEYCLDCQEQLLIEAIAKASKARQKGAKRYKLVPIEESVE